MLINAREVFLIFLQPSDLILIRAHEYVCKVYNNNIAHAETVVVLDIVLVYKSALFWVIDLARIYIHQYPTKCRGMNYDD